MRESLLVVALCFVAPLLGIELFRAPQWVVLR